MKTGLTVMAPFIIVGNNYFSVFFLTFALKAQVLHSFLLGTGQIYTGECLVVIGILSAFIVSFIFDILLLRINNKLPPRPKWTLTTIIFGFIFLLQRYDFFASGFQLSILLLFSLAPIEATQVVFFCGLLLAFLIGELSERPLYLNGIYIILHTILLLFSYALRLYSTLLIEFLLDAANNHFCEIEDFGPDILKYLEKAIKVKSMYHFNQIISFTVEFEVNVDEEAWINTMHVDGKELKHGDDSKEKTLSGDSFEGETFNFITNQDLKAAIKQVNGKRSGMVKAQAIGTAPTLLWGFTDIHKIQKERFILSINKVNVASKSLYPDVGLQELAHLKEYSHHLQDLNKIHEDTILESFFYAWYMKFFSIFCHASDRLRALLLILYSLYKTTWNLYNINMIKQDYNLDPSSWLYDLIWILMPALSCFIFLAIRKKISDQPYYTAFLRYFSFLVIISQPLDPLYMISRIKTVPTTEFQSLSVYYVGMLGSQQVALLPFSLIILDKRSFTHAFAIQQTLIVIILLMTLHNTTSVMATFLIDNITTSVPIFWIIFKYLGAIEHLWRGIFAKWEVPTIQYLRHLDQIGSELDDKIAE